MASPRPRPERKILAEIGGRLKAAREAAGLTQEEAADRAGIDYKRWQRIESGQVNATVRTLVRAARAVKLTFWTLVGPPQSR